MGKAIGRLQVLTDLDATVHRLDVVDDALDAGAPVIQVRAKELDDRALLELAESIVARCRAAGATCLIDDRVDVALACGADGVHLGDRDLPVAVARRLLGPDAIIGATARDAESGRARARRGGRLPRGGPDLRHHHQETACPTRSAPPASRSWRRRRTYR